MAEPRTGTATPWHDEFERYRKAMDPWGKACSAVNKLYLRENTASKFSILWANVQTLQPAVYARVPSAVVSRRFKDADPVARTAVEAIERAINYTLDAYDFDQTMRQGRDDYLLYGRATAWLRYEPTMRTIDVPLEDVQTGADPYQTDALDDDGEPREDDAQAPASYEEIDFERVCVDYVHRDDFGHTPARTWGEVWAVWRKAYLTRDELVKRFPEKDASGTPLGKRIPLDHTPAGISAEADSNTRERTCKATIYEVWSKRDRKVFFVAHDFPDVLEEIEPFLTLANFWPCPKPAYGTLTNDSLAPVPDYKFYQDQAEEIDRLTAKIDTLEKGLRLAGFYPSGPSGDGTDAIREAASRASMESEFEVKLIPVSGWSAFAEKGGASQIQWLPLNHVIEALRACVELRDQLITDIYQITGISDIVRGDTNPNETATAQGLKSQWGSIRIRDRQMELARFAKDIVVIAGEIIAEKFQAETLQQMTGIPLAPAEMPPVPPMQPGMPPEALQQLQQQMQEFEQAEQQKAAVMQLLRDDAQRGFRVEIETDSTIEADQQAEKQAAVELVGMMGQFFQQSLPVIQMFPPAADLIGQTMLLALRRFRAGRELEGAVETLADQLKGMSAPQPAPTGLDPAIAQQEAEMAGQKAQIEMQATQAKAAATVQAAEASMAKTQMDAQAHAMRNQSDIERMQVEAATRNMMPEVVQ